MQTLVSKFLFLIFLFFTNFAQAQFSALAIFEAIARQNLPQATVTDLCAGIERGGRTGYACQNLVGDGKTVCDGVYSGSQRTYSCAKFNPSVQKVPRDICDGIYYGVQRNYSCEKLRPSAPQATPPEFYAMENCQGIYQSQFNPNICAKLTGARAVAICHYIRNWNPGASICR